MDDSRTWRQVNIAFPDWNQAESAVLAHLAPHLAAAEAEGMIDAWFFIRKHPCWRVRYLPAAAGTETRIEGHLDDLTASRQIDSWTTVIYEPETHAFGGVEAMAAAHRLFHQDSRCLLAYLQGNGGAGTGHRREISIMLCAILMRAAGQDWYEQGDVWARVATHREPPAGHGTNTLATLHASVRRLMSVDAASQMCDNASLAHIAQWADAYATAGRELANLAAAGALHRGLRDILAHHVIFAWNRLGLPYVVQAVLAASATTVVFGPDPTTPAAVAGEAWRPQKTG
jgi:thiopeptide-type bacteriocin biosynthesis protein